MAVENRRTKLADRWDPPRSADLWPGQPTWLCDRWASPLVRSFLVSSRSFLSWCRESNRFLVSVCLFGEYDSGPGAVFWIYPVETYIHQNSWNSVSINPILCLVIDLCPYSYLVDGLI
jgi:hypothetical protein